MADLAANLDPKILASAFGMDPEAALYYTADRVDEERMTQR